MEKSKGIEVGTMQTRCIVASVAIETRADEQGATSTSRRITGYAVRFNEQSKPFWDEWVEVVDPNALDHSDLSDVVMCIDHSNSCTDILARRRDDGSTLDILIDDQGVKFSFDAPNTTAGNDVLELVRRGDISECSFKFSVEEDRWLWRSSQNGLKYDLRTITKIRKLYDLSLVVSPQYDNTSAIAERSAVSDLRRHAAIPSGIAEVVKARDFLNIQEQTF